MGGFAWVTLATNDSYSLGALVLAHSLRRVGTKHDLAVLITPGVTQSMREKLSAIFTVVQEVNVLDSRDEANLALLARPELGITFTKLHCWRLTQYERCVFVDADTLVVRNCDELFDREELSAAPDVGWPDCFNSGVFVFTPSQQTFASLTSFAASQGSFDGGDQGLLNSYFSDWAHKDISKHLPFIYNMSSTATYSYLPAYKQFGEDVRIIHFIGSTKPWLQYFDSLTGEVQPAPGSNHLQPLLQLWWNIFCESVHRELSPVMSGIAGALAQLTLGESRSPEQVALEEHMRKYSWEQGQIDYMGRDSFDNIWKKICTTLDATPSTKEKTPVKETTPPVDDEKSPPLPAATATATPPVKGAEEAVPQKPDVITESPPEKLPQEPTSDVTLEPQPTAASQITEKQSTEKQEEPVPPKEDPKESSTPTTEQPSSPLAEVLRLAAAPPLLSLASPPPVLSLTSSPPVLSIKESGEKAQSLTTASPKPKEEDEEKPEESRETVIPLGYTSPTTFESTTSLNLSESEQPQDPEDVPESPVPIQVAESVLEADIKESVSEHIKPVTEEAISSISAPVQESVSAIVEPLEAAAPVQAPPSLEAVPSHPNGTGGFDSDVKSDEDTPLVAASAAVAAPLVQPETISFTSQAEVTPEVAPAEIPEIPEDSQVPEAAPAAEEVAAAAIAAQPSPEVLERLPEPQEKSPESLIQQLPVEEPPQPSEPLDVSPPTESSEETPDPEPDTPEPSPKSTSPEKFPVPRTPTVIEATPPTSPQFELSEGQSEEAKAPKKATKKLVKKMSSEEKTESSEADEAKKPAKKVVKKVVKKPKEGEEGAEGSASMEKPKKVVRIVKKVPKCETLQTDASVPETPPPPTSDTPVPPKRKGKPGTTKPTKKPDSEQ
ncbi:fibrous sheath CABYR-binding protein isoform X2 [Diachasma alloeum]|uniref:fibrous sheath CABYR-binding protein isoform X2 n=1 Tax=Diachasma alloeum TaxID=454923 RepID=UPI0007381636|nr:fibrous sheath CABYR-binding protein isoform X2 [Diachasma alloeum]